MLLVSLPAGCLNYLLLPLFLPVDDVRGGPCILATSRLLSFKVPPANLPTVGTSTPRSRRLLEDFLVLIPFDPMWLAFSRITPFSLACARRLCSCVSAFLMIPLRCATGMFCCVNSDVFAPNDCSLRSRAICRCLEGFVDVRDFSSKCDSARSLCKARSCFKLSVSERASSGSLLLADFIVDCSVWFVGSRGGRED